MKFTMRKFLGEQLSTLPPVLHEDLSGKTVIVVGANNGIGFEATKHFATMNPGKLIMACRSQSRGEAALKSEYSNSFVTYPISDFEDSF